MSETQIVIGIKDGENNLKSTCYNPKMIKKIINIVKSGKCSCSVPQMPTKPLRPEDFKFLDIELSVVEEGKEWPTIIVRVRKHDLYLIGFHTEKKWYELRNQENRQFITGSTLLPFGESYTDLQQGDEPVRIGWYKLKDAITTLAETKIQSFHDEEKRKEQKKSLVVLITMFCEACRFHQIFKDSHMKMTLKGRTQEALGPGLEALVNAWEEYSQNIYKSANTGRVIPVVQNYCAEANEIKDTRDLVDTHISLLCAYDENWNLED